MRTFGKLYIVLSVFITLILLSACNKTYIGKGEVVSDTRDLSKFDRIALNMNADVKITDGAGQSCVVNAQQNIQEGIVTRVDGSTLVITSKGILVTDEPVEILIGMNRVAAMEVNGSGMISTTNTLKSEAIDFEVNGSGKLNLDVVTVKMTGAVSGSGTATLLGSANEMHVELNGSGLIDGNRFNTLFTKVKISGSGEASLFVDELLEASVNGSGTVKYRGNAVVKQKISGSGEIIKLD